jgi:guanylate kinase
MHTENLIKMLILVGPSYCGKTHLQERLLKIGNFKRIISSTSRKMREGEKDGIHYFFRDRIEMLKKLENDRFLQSVEYGGNIYGTEMHLYEDLINSETTGIFVATPEAINDTIDMLKTRGISVDMSVVYFAVSDDLLRSHGAGNDSLRDQRADTRKTFMEMYNRGDFKKDNINIKIISDGDVNDDLAENLNRELFEVKKAS